MNRYLLIKVVSAIIFAVASATGYTLDITQITNLNFKWLPLIFFSFFIALVIWIFVDLYGQINKLLDSRPMIDVKPIEEGDILYLQVHNYGAEGIFKAQIELTADDPSVWSLSHYNGYWKYGNNTETKILKGHNDMIKIAEVISRPNSNSENLKIIFFDERVNYAHHVSSSSHWIGATITDENGYEKPLTKHEYRFCVTISSSPELKGGIYQRQFSLNIDGWLEN